MRCANLLERVFFDTHADHDARLGGDEAAKACRCGGNFLPFLGGEKRRIHAQAKKLYKASASSCGLKDRFLQGMVVMLTPAD